MYVLKVLNRPDVWYIPKYKMVYLTSESLTLATFLAHDATHNHGLRRCTVSVHLSVCLSHSHIPSKQINISSICFTMEQPHHWVCHTKHDGNVPTGTPSWFLTNIWLWIIKCRQWFQQWGKVYHSRHWRQSPHISELCLWQQSLTSFYQLSATGTWNRLEDNLTVHEWSQSN